MQRRDQPEAVASVIAPDGTVSGIDDKVMMMSLVLQAWGMAALSCSSLALSVMGVMLKSWSQQVAICANRKRQKRPCMTNGACPIFALDRKGHGRISALLKSRRMSISAPELVVVDGRGKAGPASDV
jgi:hypothetical protein